MKFTLKDYQSDAVADVLKNLKDAKSLFKGAEKKNSSFSLTATTGAGKTVMAAAAIEALFWGSDTFDFAPDPGAVVLWFSDDPSLNKQTFNRLMQASEKFNYSNMVFIEPPFARPRLEPGKVYFLNTQRLTKTSLLTRGHVESEGAQQHFEGPLSAAAPDMQGWNIWETLANTIQDDQLTLYLVLDEAHRGFDGTVSRDKNTIVRRLVNGTRTRPAIPVVWGISATIERFETAMQEAEATYRRQKLAPVIVHPARVQESGLVKDTLVLDIPNEAGNFDSVLVKRAARKLKDSTQRWATYCADQGLPEPVQPLLILQTPNTPDPDEIGVALDSIFEEYPALSKDSIRHVLGDHKTQKFGAWDVDWIEPQRVQDESHVRVIIAKDAISTGWDCPRAEVLVSFRSPAKDNFTHITQLLGRMVRNPLARRIPGDERLNSVDCILPFFDRTTAGKVVKFLTGNLDSMPGSAKKTILDGKELLPNPDVPEAVWKLWEKLPTETLPQRGARPIKRLVALAQALSADGIKSNALKDVQGELHSVLEGYSIRYKEKVETSIAEVWAVHVQEIAGKFGGGNLTYSDFIERADDRAIRSGFEFAKKAFGADIAQSFVNHLAESGDSGDDDTLREAYVRAAALATVKSLREKVDEEAEEIFTRLDMENRSAIRKLPDLRQQAYEEIRAMATTPQRGVLRVPRNRIEDFSVELDDGEIRPAQVVDLHLLADEEKKFPIGTLNTWEHTIVTSELRRENVLAWYRNPSRAAVDALGVAYRDENTGNWRSMHPDFVFFHEKDGKVVASILDPHRPDLQDAMMKLRALAEFARKYGTEFDRIESLAEVNGVMKYLDMKLESVRELVTISSDAVEVFKNPLAKKYEMREQMVLSI